MLPDQSLEGGPASPPLRPPPVPGPPASWPRFSPPPHPGDRDRVTGRAALIGGLVGALVAMALISVVLVLIERDGDRTPASAPPAPSARTDIGAVLACAGPSVVTIETTDRTRSGVFGGAGTGIVLSEDGQVLTNAHVVAGLPTIAVTLADGTTHPAELIGSEPQEDIALIQVLGVSGLTPALFGSSADLRVGDDVVAIGTALNLGGPPSVTRGIVSATGRRLSAGTLNLDDLIQTDAAINPGNSGGPLTNLACEVVGVNTAIIGDAQNVGFAIAIDSVKPLIADIRAGGGTIRGDQPFLGVETRPIDAVDADELDEAGVETDTGAFVVGVIDDTGAAAAGIEVGDVIIEIDGKPIAGPDANTDVGEAIISREVGDTVEIVLERRGERLTITATLGERP